MYVPFSLEVRTCYFVAIAVGAVGVRHHLGAPRRTAGEKYLHHLQQGTMMKIWIDLEVKEGLSKWEVMWIRIGFNWDPDQNLAFKVTADLDLGIWWPKI